MYGLTVEEHIAENQQQDPKIQMDNKQMIGYECHKLFKKIADTF